MERAKDKKSGEKECGRKYRGTQEGRGEAGTSHGENSKRCVD
jgi:hypothetical protein